jgi:arylformamidase
MLLPLALFFAAQTAPTEAAPAPPAPAQVVRDVRYAETEGVDAKSQSLDIYLPGTPGPHPVMVMVHGGGWRLGDKANRAMWKDKAPHFNREGWVYISINYRLSNGEGLPPHPAHVQDVAKALAWVHNNIKQHGGDPEQIYLMGHSSGAHLVALVSTDERRLAAEGKKLSIIQGTVCLDTAGYDIEKYLGEMDPGRTAAALYSNAFGTTREGWRDASPRHHVAKDKDIPPMLLVHTQGRTEVARLSAEMVAALRMAGVPATAIHAADKNHAGINACIGQKGDPYTALIMQFLADPTSASKLKLPKARVGQGAANG